MVAQRCNHRVSRKQPDVALLSLAPCTGQMFAGMDAMQVSAERTTGKTTTLRGRRS